MIFYLSTLYPTYQLDKISFKYSLKNRLKKIRTIYSSTKKEQKNTLIVPLSQKTLTSKEIDSNSTTNLDQEKSSLKINPFLLLEQFQEGIKTIQEIDTKINSIDSKIYTIHNVTNEILENVKEKPKKKKNSLPLREPLNNEIYFYLMSLKLQKREKKIQYSRFRIAITLLWATGLRVNEIRTITKQDLDSILSKKSLQIYQPKTKKYRIILFNDYTLKQFKSLKKDIMILFQGSCNLNLSNSMNSAGKLNSYKDKKNRVSHEKKKTLAGDLGITSWIHFINKRLDKKTKKFGLNIKSHSFRVNYVTSLLKHAPLQVVSNLVGHSDIKTTVKYNRYYPNQKETLTILDQAFR